MLADAFLEPMVDHMNELGWDVYSFDHEGGDGQYEFDFGYTDALEMADRMLIFRLMAKHVARTLGCFASFMPKPFQTALRLRARTSTSASPTSRPARTVFDGQPRRPGPTATGTTATAGRVPVHRGRAGARAARSRRSRRPTVNSYKRLHAARAACSEISWAPVFQAWGYNNRTLMCRLPMNRRCLEAPHRRQRASTSTSAPRWCWRPGWTGSARELEPGDPVNIDTYKISDGRPGRGAACGGCRGRSARRSSAFEAERLRARGARRASSTRPTSSSSGPSGRSTTPSSASGSRASTCGCGERGDADARGQCRGGRPDDRADPVLVDVQPAGEVVPGMTRARSSPPDRRCPGRSTTAASAARSLAARSTRAWPPTSTTPTRKLRRRRGSSWPPPTTTAASARSRGSTRRRCRCSWSRTRADGNRALLQLLRGRVAAPAELRLLQR